MENIEIVFKNFPKVNLNKFVEFELLRSLNNLKTFNFFDSVNKRDVTAMHTIDIFNALSPRGCGTFVFSNFKFGIYLGDTVIAFSFDENAGDIVINFEMKLFLSKKKSEIINMCKKIIETALQFKKVYFIQNILIGLEPAEDRDTCFLNLGIDNINLTEASKILSTQIFKFNENSNSNK